MLLGGLETMPTTIEWEMPESLRNLLVMKKLQDKIECVIGLGHMVRESNLPFLVYSQVVVKETL